MAIPVKTYVGTDASGNPVFVDGSSAGRAFPEGAKVGDSPVAYNVGNAPVVNQTPEPSFLDKLKSGAGAVAGGIADVLDSPPAKVLGLVNPALGAKMLAGSLAARTGEGLAEGQTIPQAATGAVMAQPAIKMAKDIAQSDMFNSVNLPSVPSFAQPTETTPLGGTGVGRADYQGAPFATGNIGPGGEGGAPTTQPTINEAIQSMAGAPSTISGPDLLKSAVEKQIAPQGPTAATAGQITAGTYDTAGTTSPKKPGMATPKSRPGFDEMFPGTPVDIATPMSLGQVIQQQVQRAVNSGGDSGNIVGGIPFTGGGGDGRDSSVVGGYDTGGTGIVDSITGGLGPGGGGGDIASQVSEATSTDASGIGGDSDFGALAGGGSLSRLLRGYYE